MKSQDAKSYLTGLCLAALLSGGSLAAPGLALGSSGCASGGKTAQSDGTADGTAAGGDAEEKEEEAEGNGS
ncbi:SbtA family thio(seleno)oxazole RiPP natural product precursor [Desulfurivibrio sp. C05AmB]|uniref:SbtA family thio(seleno)oxazole RiPP natural product precursor n=1 Tax=Desulfurivibrio sp. C05AmB TaxID=3374371 RepID=UPI00376EBD30